MATETKPLMTDEQLRELNNMAGAARNFSAYASKLAAMPEMVFDAVDAIESLREQNVDLLAKARQAYELAAIVLGGPAPHDLSRAIEYARKAMEPINRTHAKLARAADTIAALQEQNRKALADVDTVLASHREAKAIVNAVAEALDCSTSDGAIQEALESLQWKAQQWDAATAAGALDHSGLLKAYNTEANLSFEGALAAVAAHVRAHDAAAFEAQQDEHAKECDRQRAAEQWAVCRALGDTPSMFDDGSPSTTDEFVKHVLFLVRQREEERAGDTPLTEATNPSDAIAEWLADHRVGNVRARDWVVSGDDVRRLARAFTALVAEVRSLRADRECGGEK